MDNLPKAHRAFIHEYDVRLYKIWQSQKPPISMRRMELEIYSVWNRKPPATGLVVDQLSGPSYGLRI